LGRVAVVPDNIKKGIINQALLKLTPKKKIKVHFLKYWLRSSIFQKIIFEYSGGAAIPNVPSAKILKEIVIPYPRIEEQEHFIAKIEIILAETKQLEVIYQQKLTQLEDLKKSILQKAFNGNLKEIKYENF
jgi:type I restriction enzyme S subunit